MDRQFQEIEVRAEQRDLWTPTKESIDHFLSIWTNYHLGNVPISTSSEGDN